MWLIDRQSQGRGGPRILLPEPVRAALVRWYTGDGSHHDEEAGIVLVQQARRGGKWIACDCLAAGEDPPVLTPAFLSEAETYYLRRLTGSGRPEHDADCPFFREQATNRRTEVRGPDSPADPPHGFFEALRPAPEKLAQRPTEDSSDDRTRQAAIPRLARLLWRLVDTAGRNRCGPICDEAADHSIGDEFRALTRVAGRIEIAPGLELGRAFWTHAQALHSKRVYAGLRDLARRWPRGHAPQAFLALFAQEIRGATIKVAGCAPVQLANRVQSPSSRENRVGGPYLVLVVVGEYPEAHGYAPLRGYAQPILSGRRFVPVESEFERDVARALFAARRKLDRAGLDVLIEKPVFDSLTPLGACRPDFLIEVRSRLTGECRQLIIETVAAPDTDRRPVSARPALETIAPVQVISPHDLANGDIEQLLKRAVDL